ncbi:hypothetical protein HY772_09210 [Candidatus Woesearchaeota archaeon]|nr:hypothetical protein [Candidatus Woesearchaeota archaeon]
MSSMNKLDAVLAVDDLTDEAAAIVEGGGFFRYSVRFDTSQSSGSFFAARGRSVSLHSTTVSGRSNKFFTAVLRNLKTGNTSRQTVAVGDSGALWTGVRGGFYEIDLVDGRDGVFVFGKASVLSS